MLLTFLLSFFVSVEVRRRPAIKPRPFTNTRNNPPKKVGIVISIAISMVLCIKQSAAMRVGALSPRSRRTQNPDTAPQVSILGRVPGTQYYEPLDDDDDDGLFPSEEIPGALPLPPHPGISFSDFRVRCKVS